MHFFAIFSNNCGYPFLQFKKFFHSKFRVILRIMFIRDLSDISNNLLLIYLCINFTFIFFNTYMLVKNEKLFDSILSLFENIYLIITDLAQAIKKLKRKWYKNQRAVVQAQRSNNTSFSFQYQFIKNTL